MKIWILIGGFALLMLGCNQPASPSPTLSQVRSNLCGSYKGFYANGMESFEINNDGTFRQKFVQGGQTIYDQGGKWSFKKLEDRYLITFEPFMNLNDAILSSAAPKRFDSGQGTFYDDEYIIWFFRDIHYYISKGTGASK